MWYVGMVVSNLWGLGRNLQGGKDVKYGKDPFSMIL